MIKERRFNFIRGELAKKENIEVEELVALLHASKATIRRDLDEMAAMGLLKRTHGGATQTDSSIELPYQSKLDLFRSEKRAIGILASSLIEEPSVIACTGGTTVMHAAQALKDKRVTVVTNAINIAQELTRYDNVQVVVAGGALQPRSYELVGHITDRTIGDFYFDIALIGVDGISIDRGISTYTIGEAHTALQFIEHAKSAWVVADHSKIGRTAPAIIAPLARIARLITDPGADPAARREIESAGIEVLIAEM